MAARNISVTVLVSLLVSSLAGACSSDKSKAIEQPEAKGKTSAPDAAVVVTEKEDPEPTTADFGCILNGTKVQGFYAKNRHGGLANIEKAATSDSGGMYPVGSVLQLIPTEAMVKRYKGYSSDTNDWEFFALKVTGTQTEIAGSGTTEVINAFNLNCFDCHKKAEPQFDLVCEKTHGCDPLPFTDDQIAGIQTQDSRCPKDAGH